MNALQLRFEPEDEWHGKLIAACSVNGFSGCGAAWFSTSKIQAFCTALESFPLSTDGSPSLAGGFWTARDNIEPEQVHLGIEVAPHDARGELRVTVRLASEVWKGNEQDLQCQTTMRFLTTYGEIGSFAAALRFLVDGNARLAELGASVGT